MNKRLKEIRNYFDLSQKEFSTKINVGQSTLAMLETGQRSLKDIHISQVCNSFKVNEDWLRNGTGKMFVEPDTFSLDEYAQQNSLTPLETEIIKGYMSLDKDIRQRLMAHFEEMFIARSETVAAKEVRADLNMDAELEAKMAKEVAEEVANYEKEVWAEKRAQMSRVSQNSNGKIG